MVGELEEDFLRGLLLLLRRPKPNVGRRLPLPCLCIGSVVGLGFGLLGLSVGWAPPMPFVA